MGSLKGFTSVVGVDVAPSMLEAARQLLPDRANCEFRLNQTNNLGWSPDGSFDFVLSLLVLQHLDSTETIKAFLREFVRVLRPGGAIVVQLPSSVPAHKIPLPSWRSRSGIRIRTARLLRRIGVPANVLYRRLGWVPEMTLLALSDEVTRTTLEGAGGVVVHVTPAMTDSGGTIDRTWFITREFRRTFEVGSSPMNAGRWQGRSSVWVRGGVEDPEGATSRG